MSPSHSSLTSVGAQPTLTGMLAQQRQADIARAAERRRLVTVALEAILAPRRPRHRVVQTLTRVQDSLRAAKPTLARVLGDHAARTGAPTAGPASNQQLACCA